MNLILRIYDFFRTRKRAMWASLAVLTAVCCSLLFNLKFSENINDFLPASDSDREALSVYQNISGASRLYFLFNNPGDADVTVAAMDSFAENVARSDSLGWCSGLTVQVDMSMISEVTEFVCENMPYFLDEDDYERMDSLLASPGYIRKSLENDRNMLMFPTGNMISATVSRDPLSLFSPVMKSLAGSAPGTGFEMYDGYIFTPDMSRAVAMMDSPFGNAETEHNSRLVKLLHEAADLMHEEYPSVTVDIVGGPEIAVGNSSRIKKDSIMAISLSVILIILLVIYSIGSLRNILLIFISIGWGWLFAMAGISVFSGNVSIIVIGISSVILGIAVNYPLHLIAHTTHSPDMRQTIREIFSPLVIGNITTVGAFLALVPLKAVALRDLGMFASLLLVGTILFVLLYLPHFVEIKKGKHDGGRILEMVASMRPEKSVWLVSLILILTVVLSFFSMRTGFDTNMANINYMTAAQKADMAYFQSLLSQNADPDMRTVYVLSSGDDFDEALQDNFRTVQVTDSLVKEGVAKSGRGVQPFLTSKSVQQKRLDLWADFVARHHDQLTRVLPAEAASLGFSPDAFDGFLSIVDRAGEFIPQDIEHFSTLTKLILSGNVTSCDGHNYIVQTISVHKDNVAKVKTHFDWCFDVSGMNSALAENLSDNFNYIGWACSMIVFFFLWYSFGSFELALISFLPMAVSWIWILGIMAVFGIKFNIVNIILATFIFGQGDDYTIFMTEGCQYEYARRKPILASYKSSILQSALIMFVGIGTLVISKHPAMKSLAQVTITGMFSVILMAYVIPPLVFGWMTTRGGKVRRHPLTLKVLLFGEPKDPYSQVLGRYLYKGKDIVREVRSCMRRAASSYGVTVPEGVSEYTLVDNGYGETAMLIALTHPGVLVRGIVKDEEKRRIATVAAEDFVDNLVYLAPPSEENISEAD